MADVKAFIHASPEIRLARRKDRDLNVRGYAPEEVDYQWKHHVSPAYSAHIEPHKPNATWSSTTTVIGRLA